MTEINARIVPLRSVEYSVLLDFIRLSTKDITADLSDYVDHFHQLYFSDKYDGRILLIDEHPVAALLFPLENPNKISFAVSNPLINDAQTIGLLLHNHLNLYNLKAYELQFRLWSHQEKLMEFLRTDN